MLSCAFCDDSCDIVAFAVLRVEDCLQYQLLSMWDENSVMFDLGCLHLQFHFLGRTRFDQWMDSSVFGHRAEQSLAVRPVVVQFFCLVWSMGCC